MPTYLERRGHELRCVSEHAPGELRLGGVHRIGGSPLSIPLDPLRDIAGKRQGSPDRQGQRHNLDWSSSIRTPRADSATSELTQPTETNTVSTRQISGALSIVAAPVMLARSTSGAYLAVAHTAMVDFGWLAETDRAARRRQRADL